MKMELEQFILEIKKWKKLKQNEYLKEVSNCGEIYRYIKGIES
jgi:hypothetical protein